MYKTFLSSPCLLNLLQTELIEYVHGKDRQEVPHSLSETILIGGSRFGVLRLRVGVFYVSL